MIKSVMLVLLGFFAASLLAVVFAPAFWARAVRLTRERIRASLPVTEAEVRAEKDQLRAQYAVRIHQLQKALDEAKVREARQKITLNRRNSEHDQLKKEFDKISAELTEQMSARNVLEQTINERLPQTQGRLKTAMAALEERDELIASMQTEADKQAGAAQEFEGLIRALKSENDQLKLTLSNRQDRERQDMKFPAHETEAALRTELDQLRAKVSEQSSSIASLQQRLIAAKGAGTVAAADTDRDWDLLRQQFAEQGAELEKAHRELAAFALASEAHTHTDTDDGPGLIGAPTLGERYQALANICDDQKQEIRALQAERDELRDQLAARQGAKDAVARETRADLKGRIRGLEGKEHAQKEVISGLRAELAASTKKTAEQAKTHGAALRKLTGFRPGNSTQSEPEGQTDQLDKNPATDALGGDDASTTDAASRKSRLPKPTLVAGDAATKTVAPRRGLRALAAVTREAVKTNGSARSKSDTTDQLAGESPSAADRQVAEQPVPQAVPAPRPASFGKKKSKPPAPFGTRPLGKKAKKSDAAANTSNGSGNGPRNGAGNSELSPVGAEPTPLGSAKRAAPAQKKPKLLDRIRGGIDK